MHEHKKHDQDLETFYRTVFENTGSAICVLEEDDTISLCNEEFCRLTRYPREEIEGKKDWPSFVHPEDLPRMREYHRARRRDPLSAPRNYEFRLFDRHGGSKHIWLTVALIPGTNRSVASLLDISPIKEKERLLRLAEQNYHSIFDNAGDAIFIHDAETGRILDMNPRACELYGYTCEEALRLGVEGLSAGRPPYSRREAMERIRSAAAGPQLFEWLARKKSGRAFWVEVDLRRAAIGGEERILAFVRDITARKKAEARLAREQERFRVTLASIGDAVICTDRAGRVTFFNHVAEQLTGWPRAEALGRPLPAVFHIESELTGRRMADPTARVLREGVVVGLANHTLLVNRDGRRIPISDSGAPIRDASGDILGVVLVFRDETERRRTERERKEAAERLAGLLQNSIQAMARLVEMRDPYTAGHQHRVAELSCAIARQMGLAEERIEALRMAAHLHDIGKIVVPAAILNKPARLGREEMALVAAHPVTAYEILREIDFPWPVADIVRQHHERLDGSGYPDGRKDDGILLEARILAVADVIDAITSHRPYRPAHPPEAALEEVIRHRGTLYDPAVVDAALAVFRGDLHP
ncbi:MAG: PAS domain S-box protein [Thermoanaerobacterales bacterium]|nr:PAS domain S-box protein [Thermoanaerobacterales bacterium]